MSLLSYINTRTIRIENIITPVIQNIYGALYSRIPQHATFTPCVAETDVVP